MIAGAMQAGILPHNEFGLRFFDALFGAVAFVYVYLLGRWLAGPVCGLVGVLLLFVFDPLIFDHGLRSNNMEGPLFLAYCGGLYHFAKWAEDAPGRRPANACAVGAYFVLGFMTKFVAALFLPIVCVVALALRADAWTTCRERWRDWVGPAVLVAVFSVPWFVMQHQQHGDEFWRIIIGQHVYVRFTGALDPEHFRPWHFYYSQLWRELIYARSLLVSVGGMVLLAAGAWTGWSWLARLLLVWWAVPFALMSFGTSKLIHYTFPFLPPVALAGGWLAAAMLRSTDGRVGTALSEWLNQISPSARRAGRHADLIRRLLVAGGVVAVGLAAWTAVWGRVLVEVGEVQLFRNSSAIRPLLLGALMLGLSGYVKLTLKGLAVLAVAVLLPLSTYVNKAQRTTSVDHPLRTIRDCARRVQASGVAGADGVYVHVFEPVLHHSYYYYFWRLGPWLSAERPWTDELSQRLFTAGDQTLVVMSRADYWTLASTLGPADAADRPLPDVEPRTPPAEPPERVAALLPGVMVSRVAIVMPGAYAVCVPEAEAAGATSMSTMDRVR